MSARTRRLARYVAVWLVAVAWSAGWASWGSADMVDVAASSTLSLAVLSTAWVVRR